MCCVILSFTASIPAAGREFVIRYCKTVSIVMFFSEGQTEFGDFTFARGEECLDSHLETVTESSRSGQEHFIYVLKKQQIILRLGRANLHFISQ